MVNYRNFLIAAVLSAAFPAFGAAGADYRIVAADQSTSSLVMLSGAPGAQAEILWRWDSRKDSKILPTYRNSFRNIDECKPSADGSEILANASCGGVAAVDVATASVKWYAYLPKWNAGPHSLCVLPDGKVAVANSTGVDALQIIDVSAAPLDPVRQKVVKAMSLPGAHGVVWDARRGSLFALGYTNLYELAYSSADMSVSVKRSWDYSAKLCDQYGHDLVADGSGGYFLTNHTAVWHLDPDADRWTKVRDMANVKSFSRDAKRGDLITIAKEKWWTDELKIIEPDGTTRVVGPFPGARFYKARWM